MAGAPRDPSRPLGDGLDAGSAIVAEQGAWILLASLASSGLGFVFWWIAARLFLPADVGIAASLVSLASLTTAIATLGLDFSFVRFAPRVRDPLRMLRALMAITGIVGAVVGVLLPVLVLTFGRVDSGAMVPLLLLSVFLAVSTAWNELMNGALMAAQKSHLLAAGITAYSVVKVASLGAVLSAGPVGLLAAYSIPMAVLVLVDVVVLVRLWRGAAIREGAPPSFRDLASLSAGNWIGGLVYSLPARAGPALMLIYLDPTSVAFFFIALQLAEVLNYVSESFSKSLLAHGSRQDRLTRPLTARLRRLLALVLVPLVVVGIVAAPIVLSVVGGPPYQAHSLALQLFLLATIPRGYFLVLRAQFNVEQRPLALLVSGGTLGASTLALFVVGLALRIELDLLPAAWIFGAVMGWAVGQVMARPRRGMGARTPALR